MNPSHADIINGLFELGGAIFLLENILLLYKDKVIKGVSWRPTIYFSSWGLWNAIIYYPSLEQWWSFTGGIAICTVNFIWLCMVYYYLKIYPRKSKNEESCIN